MRETWYAGYRINRVLFNGIKFTIVIQEFSKLGTCFFYGKNVFFANNPKNIKYSKKTKINLKKEGKVEQTAKRYS